MKEVLGTLSNKNTLLLPHFSPLPLCSGFLASAYTCGYKPLEVIR